ncbi:uridine kinase [Streptomyces sp. NPDC101191]|uniref:uridine kinase family protein n=1 Tax=Streptomyces sp. NPDC101191 TaxID=3366126 RepID=UPI0037FF991D
MTTPDTTGAVEHVLCPASDLLGPEAGGTLLPGEEPPARNTAAVSDRTPVLAVAGGTASGKSTFAKALALHRPGAVALIHLDDFYEPAHDPQRGIRTMSATGVETLDWNHPGSIDQDAAAAAVDTAATSGQHQLVVVEGLLALTLPKVAARATWRVYVDAPDDIRLARKLLRKIKVQNQDPAISLHNYLLTGRDRHAEHVAPSRYLADLVLDGTMPTAHLLTAVDDLIGPHLSPAR